MKARLLVSLVGIPALLGILWAGFPFLTILVAGAALVGLWEFHRLALALKARPNLPLGALWTLAFVVNGQIASQHGSLAPHIIGAGLIVTLAWALARRRGASFLRSWLLTAAGPLYVGFLLSHALLLREGGNGLYDGRAWLLYALFATFATDTGAYLVGRAFGRHRLAPTISPSKTWEGALGGLVLAAGASMGLCALLDLPVATWLQPVLGLALGVVAQGGDMLESLLKRRAGVKDAGGLLPGHGGLLDRMDSLLLTIPVTHYSLALVLS